MPPAAWLALTVFLLAALQSGAALATWRPRSGGETVFSTPEADVTHLVMNGLMAAMATPLYGPAFRAAACAALALTAAVVGLALLARRKGPLSFRAYAVGAAYHVLMLAAMIYAIRLMGGGMGATAAGSMGNAGMAQPAGTHPSHGGLTPAHLLAALFALDALTGLFAVIALPRQLIAAEQPTRYVRPTIASDGGEDVRNVRLLRLSFLPHLVMDAGMVWMLANV